MRDVAERYFGGVNIKVKGDEMVFLSILSNPFNSYWSTSYLYLWGYQFIVLVKNTVMRWTLTFPFP